MYIHDLICNYTIRYFIVIGPRFCVFEKNKYDASTLDGRLYTVACRGR